MFGCCSCKNIEVRWQVDDLHFTPRACQCEYCKAKAAAYISVRNSNFEVMIHRSAQHRIIRQGTNQAAFHECTACGDLVFVTARIDDFDYGVLNAMCMKDALGFETAIPTNFSWQSALQKKERWRESWCCPVKITYGLT